MIINVLNENYKVNVFDHENFEGLLNINCAFWHFSVLAFQCFSPLSFQGFSIYTFHCFRVSAFHHFSNLAYQYYSILALQRLLQKNSTGLDLTIKIDILFKFLTVMANLQWHWNTIFPKSLQKTNSYPPSTQEYLRFKRNSQNSNSGLL